MPAQLQKQDDPAEPRRTERWGCRTGGCAAGETAKDTRTGVRPLGGRFDGHQPIGEIRGRQSEIVTEPPGPRDGLAIPATERQAPAEQRRPKVRAAGRIMLRRTAGKAVFIDVHDWTGKIQLLIGKRQVGERNWELSQCLDLGDIIGVDGQLGRPGPAS